MLSRASFLSAQQSRALVAIAARATSTTATTNAPPPPAAAAAADSMRPMRQEPGKVRMGFIPEEWFQFFYKKTGVTGPYTLGFTLTTYMLSKEIIVLEHEYYSGLSLMVLCILGVKKLGPAIAQALDKEIDEYETSWNQGRADKKKLLEDTIAKEEKMQWSADGQSMLVAAKKENVQMQLESAYRERLMTAFSEVKRRLDYQVEKQEIERRIAQKNLVDWVVRRVRASITPDQDKQNIDKCIADLSMLAKA